MIRHIEGLHLTATNRRHIAQMIAAGMTRGQSGMMQYRLEPMPDNPARWRYAIAKRDRDDRGRPVVRNTRGVVELA